MSRGKKFFIKILIRNNINTSKKEKKMGKKRFLNIDLLITVLLASYAIASDITILKINKKIDSLIQSKTGGEEYYKTLISNKSNGYDLIV